jgi:dihydrofolate synthase/folylpolyglutamate synthase
MTYNEAIQYLYAKAPMFSHLGKSAYKNNLDNTFALNEYFNAPHTQYKTIHVAGTNGKGSVSHTLASVLHEAGYNVGLFTSPHLKDFRERIKINGIQISEHEIIQFIEQHKAIIEKTNPSFFEITTFMAFDYFARQHINIAVIETGLGGRLDSTNIISPILSVITNIGWDHTDLLGDSLEKIAFEKAGIIKKQIPVVIGEHQEEVDTVFVDKADELNSDIFFAEDTYTVKKAFITQNNFLQFDISKNGKEYLPALKFQLIGKYQEKNMMTILKSVDLLNDMDFNISEHHIYRGCKNVINSTGLYGRWQILCDKPYVVCDIGHNKPGLEWNLNQLAELKKNKRFFVLGFMKDKDIHEILKLFPADASYYFTQASIPRALPAEELSKIASLYSLIGTYYLSVKEAYATALAQADENDIIYIGGSTYIVAELL